MIKTSIMDAETFNSYIQQYISEIKKDLEELKKVTDSEKLYLKADIKNSGHSNKLASMVSYYNNEKLGEKGASGSELLKYETLVKELRKIKDEFYKKLKATQCEHCKKNNLVNPLVHETNSVTGVKTVFCNQNCLNSYLEKQNRYTCEWCKKSKSGQCWYPTNNGKRILKAGKFCSETCVNAWQENKNKQSQKQEEKQEVQLNKKEKDVNDNSDRGNLLTCPQCLQSITGEWVWYEDEANDNLNFCSEKCCDNYYEINGYCDGCGNVHQPPYQWITWEYLPEEKNYYYSTSVKELVEYYETKLNKTFSKDCSKKYCLPHCFCLNNGININNWNGEDLKTYLEWVNERRKKVDREQRTENREQRTENREQRTEKPKILSLIQII